MNTNEPEIELECLRAERSGLEIPKIIDRKRMLIEAGVDPLHADLLAVEAEKQQAKHDALNVEKTRKPKK